MRWIVGSMLLAAFLAVSALAQPTACEVVTDAAAATVIGVGFVAKSIPMKDDNGKAIGTLCSRRKGKQLVQVTLLPGATNMGISLQDMLKEQAQEAAKDSGSNIKITVIPQAGMGDEAFSATVESSQVPLKFSNIAVRKGKTVFFVQVFNTANTLVDALKLARGGVSRLP